MRAAWNRQRRGRARNQDIVLTVPASFGKGARFTLEGGAASTDLPRLRLLEEPCRLPRLAVSATANNSPRSSRSRLLLVCDIGGGTTDLTLIQSTRGRSLAARLTRIGVGDHPMLGSDNMDLALAHLVEKRLLAGGERPSAARTALRRCRAAKGSCSPRTPGRGHPARRRIAA